MVAISSRTLVADIDGKWTFATSALSDGFHSFSATSTDAAGNISVASAGLQITVDTVAPSNPVIAGFSPDTGVVGDGITGNSTPVLSGSAEAGSTVKIYDGSTLLGSVTANASGAWSYTTPALSNGGHNFTVTATDAAGNVSTASNPLSLTVENVAPLKPVIAGFSPDSGVVGDGITSNTTPVLSGSAEAGSTIKIYDGSTLLGSVTANASGAWSYTTPALSNGGHNFTVTATDAAGNVSTASNPLSLSVDTAAPTKPVIAGFSPDFCGGWGRRHQQYDPGFERQRRGWLYDQDLRRLDASGQRYGECQRGLELHNASAL